MPLYSVSEKPTVGEIKRLANYIWDTVPAEYKRAVWDGKPIEIALQRTLGDADYEFNPYLVLKYEEVPRMCFKAELIKSSYTSAVHARLNGEGLAVVVALLD